MCTETNQIESNMRFVLVALICGVCTWRTNAQQIPNARPEPIYRKFNSSVVEAAMSDIAGRMIDRDLATIFTNCFPNTLDTTVESFVEEPLSTFVITGDIHAQWFRDSTNQVLPYIRYAAEDPKLATMLCGLIKRQTRDILHDVYANAFNFNNEGDGHPWDKRKPEMTYHVFEGKYELDSLGAVMKLARLYYQEMKDVSNDCFAGDDWVDAMQLIIDTIVYQQIGSEEELDSGNVEYFFQRRTLQASDTLMLHGNGTPGNRCGLSKCQFRPSDDAVTFPFLIPANAMAVVELRHLSKMSRELAESMQDEANKLRKVAAEAEIVASEIDAAIGVQAVKEHLNFGRIFAYEVDGFGNSIFMDDANVPSLLSLPYLGYVSKTDETYLRTRQFVLSKNNPYFFAGTDGVGIGGPHVGLGYVWPMSIIMRAITSDSDEEILYCLDMLKRTTAGTGFMHETFWKNDAGDFTRDWFAWANTMFGELIVELAEERPHLLFDGGVLKEDAVARYASGAHIFRSPEQSFRVS